MHIQLYIYKKKISHTFVSNREATKLNRYLLYHIISYHTIPYYIIYIISYHIISYIISYQRERDVLFNDALNTFYLRLYGVRHMVKDHSDIISYHISYHIIYHISYHILYYIILPAPMA